MTHEFEMDNYVVILNFKLWDMYNFKLWDMQLKLTF